MALQHEKYLYHQQNEDTRNVLLHYIRVYILLSIQTLIADDQVQALKNTEKNSKNDVEKIPEILTYKDVAV